MSETQAEDLLTDEELRVTAALAALELPEGELAAVRVALAETLEHFKRIADVPGDPESTGTPLSREVGLDDLRPDTAALADPDPLTALAPDFEEGFFFVPRIIG